MQYKMLGVKIAVRNWDCWLSCVHGNKPLGFINGGKFLDQLSDCLLLEEDSAA